MSRQYIIVGNTTPYTGEELIDLATLLFKTELHTCGKRAKPRTVVKAIWFIQNILHKTIKTKLESEIEWKIIE